MHFLISTLIWFCVFLPMVLLSMPVVAIMLLSDWDGKTTWFGNWKYGRGDAHYKAPSEGIYWKQWRFLVIRNPASNFGKRVLSVRANTDWAWLQDRHVFGSFWFMYGWKNPVAENGYLRTFVYRPWFK